MQFLQRTVKFNFLFSMLAGLVVVILGSTSAIAQTYPAPYGTQQNSAHVTVYKDCGFRGKSRALAVGEYRDVRDLNLGNDSISSMRVPNGMQITLYKNERFGGEAVYLDRNISCLDKRWNDEASSLKVTYTNQPQVNQPRVNQGQYPNSSNQYPNSSNQYPATVFPNNARQNQNVNINALSRVSFANTSLERLSDKRWQIVNQNGSVNRFHETARVGRSIYLKEKSGNQSLQINLDRNQLVFQMPNGQPVSYPIARLEAKPLATNTFGASPSNTSNRSIAGSCFNYNAYTLGGEGGIRFHGREGFERFKKRGHKDRICHNGSLTMEISKTSPSTTVIVEIQGRKFVFAKNEKEDSLRNSWYRKKVTLRVGK